MGWTVKYTISDKLLSTTRKIGESLGELKSLRLSGQDLARLEINAREVSSYASTSIEGNPLPLTDVKRLFKTQKVNVNDSENEVLNYNKALQAIYSDVRSGEFSLEIKTLERIQGQVVQGLMDNPAHCGALRKEPVIIRNPRNLDEIVFIPPDAKDVKKLTGDLLKFIKLNLGKIDPIILAGIFHRQFVIIHPFIEGNGRTTRLFTTAILGKTGMDFFEIFSFENYYNRNITCYFKAVGLVGDYYDLNNDIEFSDWLEYFSDGILDELRRVRKTLPEKSRATPRLEAHHKKILAYIEKHGSITQREYGEISSRSLASRKLDFDKLVKFNLIKAEGIGRGTYYVIGS